MDIELVVPVVIALRTIAHGNNCFLVADGRS